MDANTKYYRFMLKEHFPAHLNTNKIYGPESMRVIDPKGLNP